MGQIITGTKRPMKTIPIMAEEYLRNEVRKKNLSQLLDKFDELVEHFANLHEQKEAKKPEMSQDNTM